MPRYLSRETMVGLVLAVLIAQLTGYHLHLCLHGDVRQTEVHTFAHEDVGCEQPNGGAPAPAEVEIDDSDRGLLKSIKLACDLPALPSAIAFIASSARPERFVYVSQLPTLDSHRALRPPLRGPPV